MTEPARPKVSAAPITTAQAARRAAIPPVKVEAGREREVPFVNDVVSWMIALRNEHGLSQRALAQRIGVDCSWISMVEAGKREPTFGLLGRITVAFPELDQAEMLLALAKYIAACAQHAVLLDARKRLEEMAQDAEEGQAMVHPALLLAAAITGGSQ